MVTCRPPGRPIDAGSNGPLLASGPKDVKPRLRNVEVMASFWLDARVRPRPMIDKSIFRKPRGS
jgi:hypothetical protein